MTLAILATGDEIVHGDTLNTNGHHIAHILCSEGIPLGLHITCSDKQTEIVRCLQFLTTQHDIIIIIGGLGPTTDDRTRFALSEFTHEPLTENHTALNHVKTLLCSANISLNAGNLQQTLFPQQAKILPNPYGSAVGCAFHWQDKIFFLLPGPPRECLPMFQNYVLPELQTAHHSSKHLLKWRIFGLAESEIAQKLEDALTGIDCQTGYRWEPPYIEFKVRCKKEVMQQVQERIEPILAPHIIASPEKKASEQLRERVQQLDQPIAIIDEATGGLLQTLLEKPQTHGLIHFNTLHKTKLYFHLSGLDEYWTQKKITSGTQVRIQYSSELQEGGESHQIPFRTALVVDYAAEWLSYRLLHLINQLHQ